MSTCTPVTKRRTSGREWALIASISAALMTVMFSATWEIGLGVRVGARHQVLVPVDHLEDFHLLLGLSRTDDGMLNIMIPRRANAAAKIFFLVMKTPLLKNSDKIFDIPSTEGENYATGLLSGQCEAASQRRTVSDGLYADSRNLVQNGFHL